MNSQNLPIWERVLVEAEWRPLLDNPTFMAQLVDGVKDMVSTRKVAGEVLAIENWPKEAHQALLTMLPENLVEAFDLSVFRADGSLSALDETEGLRLLCGYLVAGPAGCDEGRKTPFGDPMPLGPYADIAAIVAVPLPLRVEQTPFGPMRITSDDEGLTLLVSQFRCGQARLTNGSYCVEEEANGGKQTVVLANDVSESVAIDLLLDAGRRQAAYLCTQFPAAQAVADETRSH